VTDNQNVESPDLEAPDVESPQGPQETAAPEGGAPGADPGGLSSDEAAPGSTGEGGTAGLEQQLAERTADLQRLQAEFLNYKRRVDRDRDLVRENAVFAVLSPMLDVLDSIDRAREAGELEGGFKGVADQLERIVAGLGLTKFGEPGDPFDPTHHEALSHVGTDPEVDVVTCKHIAKSGYRIGDRVVRAAQVLVVDPEPIDAPTGPRPGGLRADDAAGEQQD
jgi:molecular chaperone GrpE